MSSEETGRRHYLYIGQSWGRKAEENVEEWGLQDVETLLLAMQEEQGELAQAFLEAAYEGGDPERVAEELADLGALCFQLRWSLNDCHGQPGGDHRVE
ncbi:hypothetical protein [Halovivax ruber]|uniref:hypothetical protein n=1 Tax=Halovivax ruber TaxID=387341 RepID=UPI0011E50A8C|nr:hypothetical protein [Halovivax ruber]